MARYRDKTSEEFATESMEADCGAWITYIVSGKDKHQQQLPFDAWLQHNLPSMRTRKEGVFWICIRPKPSKCDLVPDIDGLLTDWHKLQQRGEVTVPAIMSSANAHNASSGKWMAWSQTGSNADNLWRTIATAVNDGRLQTMAKVSSVDGSGQHVICIYNDDFTNEHQVYELESALRNAGVHCRLFYKPDAYTYLGIYRNNRWNIRPTLYISDYNIVTGKSQIRKNY